jgi:hypothetical protein
MTFCSFLSNKNNNNMGGSLGKSERAFTYIFFAAPTPALKRIFRSIPPATFNIDLNYTIFNTDVKLLA